jgi:enoyl-CoA hydratase/carnithine racemase
MSQATIHKSQPSEQVILLEIDHPPANSLSKAMKIKFNELLDEIEQNKSIRALIITGRGDKFCSGDDLKEATQNAKIKGGILENLKVFGQLMDRIEALPFPVIAAINGWCIGGGLELALCCDIRIASVNAKFISAGVNVGLTASAYRLPRLIGIGRAKHLLLTGTAIDAQKAEQFGLITGIYEPDFLLAKVIEMAENIANKAPLAIEAAKKIANIALEAAPTVGRKFEQKALEELAMSNDHREALNAFEAKRKPNFKGN